MGIFRKTPDPGEKFDLAAAHLQRAAAKLDEVFPKLEKATSRLDEVYHAYRFVRGSVNAWTDKVENLCNAIEGKPAKRTAKKKAGKGK